MLRYKIEGYTLADLSYGTSVAKTATLSFWVKSSATGTFGGTLINSASDRVYPYTYTITSANTWEKKIVVIPGDTTGTWLNTNGNGLEIKWSFGAGSTYTASATGAWQAGFAIHATGATALINTLNATWQITGVQFEAGSQATEFERRPYGTELALCQRYYTVIANTAGASGNLIGTCTALTSTRIDGIIFLPVSMRTAPSLSCTVGSSYYRVYIANSAYAINSISFNESSASNSMILFYNNTNVSGVTAGQAGWTEVMNTGGFVAASAEL
jgi:hypothetical protein